MDVVDSAPCKAITQTEIDTKPEVHVSIAMKPEICVISKTETKPDANPDLDAITAATEGTCTKLIKAEETTKKPILSLPNIDAAFNHAYVHESNAEGNTTKKRARSESPALSATCTQSVSRRKRRKISLRVPKCKVGDEMECLYFEDESNEMEEEGEWRLCTILAIKNSKAGSQYYVHYTDYNRRLDRWLHGNKLRKPTGKIKKPSELLLESTHNKRLTRGQKRAVFEEHHIDVDELENVNDLDIDAANNEDELYEKIHLKTNKIKNIEKIQFGKYIIDCWYFSPYPEQYIGSTRLLYICEYCLKYMKYYNTYCNHVRHECFVRHPPGNEIYRHRGISVWELDGCVDKIYCQNLCLLAKLFFDHKTLYFDVSPFLFYVICEYDEEDERDGFHLVGYFSKEKNSPEKYNLACILTMPHKQKQGFGRFIISLSYQLSKLEDKIGSPEKPLSDLGKISYRSYWIEHILKILQNYCGEISIEQISKLTCFTQQDIVSSLKEVNMLNNYKGQYVIKYREESVRKYLAEFKKREKKRINVFCAEHLHCNTVKSKNHPWIGLSSFHQL